MEDSVISNNSNKKNSTMVLVGILVVLIIVFAVVIIGREKNNVDNNVVDNSSAGELVDIENAPEAAFDMKDAAETNIPNVGTVRVVVPGTNPVNEYNRVITETGVEAENNAIPMSKNAPKQSDVLRKEDVPSNVVNINVGNETFEPRTFRTSVGAITTFTLTGIDDKAHIISFDDPSLQAVTVLVGPGQTKAINFSAPDEPGTFTYSCAYHPEEKGEMVVQ